MENRENTGALTEQTLRLIVKKYSQDELMISEAYGDGGIDPLWPRFERAALNQMDDGDTALSRYAIWANTVRDNIISALELIDDAKPEEAGRLLTRAANAMSAFSDVQAYFDPMGMGKIE